MIAIIDYGIGNLFSVVSSFKYIGADAVVTSDPETIKKADRILLPGVGAFEDAARKLRETGLDKVLLEEAKAGKPIMGICLGMQMLFEKSYEYGEHKGLGLLKGSVVPMQGVIDSSLQIPHIGYNSLIFKKNHPLLKYIKEGDFVYFVHSYYAVDCEDSLIAYSEYDKDITAIVGKDNIMGCQFHPEKSGEVGLNILRAFCEMEQIK
ncbi:MAG: imidazole glycerol phosphate synthase subunit HisH [Clostridia bacterium]|nr:imidazole glycerol phosphate synthase subunit HisH [Clostridia bacterium]